MLRDLTKNEVAEVAGGISTDLTEVYPAIIQGYYLVGWTEQIVGYNSVEWSEQKSLFTKVIHVDTFPVIEINPLYAPLIW